jgi:Fic family protein
MSIIKYALPNHWIKYNQQDVFNELATAKAAIMALKTIPFQKRWVEELQKIQLKMEVAGTSKIEGADFAGNELDVAIKAQTADELHTRSQKQAKAALRTYKWIASLPDDMPINVDLICEIHTSIVTDCDDDHCQPGAIRPADQNVTFGVPSHRGVNGGEDCNNAFGMLAAETQTTYRGHDPLIQALALHYHFAAMHPFLDGNGRTARALEALMLQRSGLKDSLFIAMSNFYYDEKRAYLDSLAAVRFADHDLTPFLKFGLRGIALQTGRLTGMIKEEVSKQLFRNLMHDLFTRLQSTRKRVIVKRQLNVLERLLREDGPMDFGALTLEMKTEYGTRANPFNALVRDLNRLISLGAISVERRIEGKETKFLIQVNLDWPSKITDTEFFDQIKNLPKSKTSSFLSA